MLLYREISEAIGVALHLPIAYLRAVFAPLLPFQRDELGAESLAQGGNQGTVLRQCLGGGTEVAWQSLGHGHAGGLSFVQIGVAGDRWYQSTVNAIEPRREGCGDRRIDVAGRVGQAPFNPTGHAPNDAGPVVVAIALPDG